MAKDDKIRMPSGQGGITRYFDESVSKIEFSPATVIVLSVLVMVVIILLNFFGMRFFT
jgi:preprotein translocase subunit Sec61beta